MLSNTPEGRPTPAPPSTPPSAYPVTQAPGLVFHEAKQAVPPSAPQRFSQEILPSLAAIQVSCITEPAAANITPLAQMLGQGEKRALVWDTLQQCGMPKSLTPPQQHALMTLLIPYVSQDGERCWKGLYRAVHDVVEERDYPLYGALGHAISKEYLPAPILFSLAEPFCDLATHNAKNERAFAPWVDLFAGRGDGPVYLFMMERMLGRIGAGELSSYDHLLSVLCKTENPVASALLLKSLNPKQQLPPSAVLLPSPGLALSFQLFETLRMAPAAVLLSFAVSGIEGIASLQTAIGALALGAISAVLRWNSLKSQLRHVSSEEFEVFKRAPFQHYAERVYRKLSEANGASEASQKILSALEENSLYHDILTRYRQKAAPAG